MHVILTSDYCLIKVYFNFSSYQMMIIYMALILMTIPTTITSV